MGKVQLSCYGSVASCNCLLRVSYVGEIILNS